MKSVALHNLGCKVNGYEIRVKALGFDNRGRLNLSRKDTLPISAGKDTKEEKDSKKKDKKVKKDKKHE